VTFFVLSVILWCIIKNPCKKREDKVHIEEKIIVDEEASDQSPVLPALIIYENESLTKYKSS
jgi:hypothetical protein